MDRGPRCTGPQRAFPSLRWHWKTGEGTLLQSGAQELQGVHLASYAVEDAAEGRLVDPAVAAMDVVVVPLVVDDVVVAAAEVVEPVEEGSSGSDVAAAVAVVAAAAAVVVFCCC